MTKCKVAPEVVCPCTERCELRCNTLPQSSHGNKWPAGVGPRKHICQEQEGLFAAFLGYRKDINMKKCAFNAISWTPTQSVLWKLEGEIINSSPASGETTIRTCDSVLWEAKSRWVIKPASRKLANELLCGLKQKF